MRYAVANNARTRLTATLLTADNTMQVESTNAFPVSPDGYSYLVSIDSEIMEVVPVSSTEFNIAKRGCEGTTPADHAIGDTVENRLTAGTYEGIMDSTVFGAQACGNSSSVAIGVGAQSEYYNKAIAKGYYSRAKYWDEEVFSLDGYDNQYRRSTLGWYGETTDATPTEIFLGGTTNKRFSVRSGSAMGINLYITAVAGQRVTAPRAHRAKRWKFEGLVRCKTDFSATSILQKTVIAAETETDGWDVVFEKPDHFSDILMLKVTGEANKTIRWIARAELEGVEF